MQRADPDEEFQNAESCRLRQRPRVAYRPDTSRAAALAGALGDQPPGGVEQFRVHAIERRTEADAARIVVVDEHARALLLGVDRDPDVDVPSHMSSSCATCFIANDSPTIPSRRSSMANGSTPISSAGMVSQYEVVCICCSGRSSSPEPTFSFV